MGEEANVSYAYLKAMQRKRKTGAERERERERERRITSRRKTNLMHMQSEYPRLISGLLYEKGLENRTLLICIVDKEDQNLLSKTHYEYHSHFNIRSQ